MIFFKILFKFLKINDTNIEGNMKYGDKIYFSDETQPVVDFKIKAKKIDKNFRYISCNPIVKLFASVSYWFVFPFVFIYYKLIKQVSFVNKKALKKVKNSGFFIYANHTLQFGDAFCPALISFPKKPKTIVNADNVSIPIIGNFLKIWGTFF